MVPMRMQVPSLASLSGLRVSCCHSCCVGYRCSSDPVFLGQWHRLAAAALIQPPAWALSYAAGAAIKKKKKKKKKKTLSDSKRLGSIDLDQAHFTDEATERGNDFPRIMKQDSRRTWVRT